ncbi:MAG TPA: hypothetical protein VEM96_00775 [Pyrinomonadaceae bacterium]|nr:hypothetical protein [Pyrinomonadaceae bacterium]
MSKLIRWETPFTDKRYPSVGLLVSPRPNRTDSLTAVVAPDGLDTYPKYLVNFGDVIAFTCMEEAFHPELHPDAKVFDEPGLSAYQYLESDWLKAYENGVHFVAGGHLGPFYHYAIFGADNNVEVITPTVPTVDRIDEKKLLVIECEV